METCRRMWHRDSRRAFESKSTAQKLGGKLGNAAIFGAGGELADVLNESTLTSASYNWKQHCQFHLLKPVVLDWYIEPGGLKSGLVKEYCWNCPQF